MQTYLYRNDERIKSVYAQVNGGLVSKTSVERSKAIEGSLGASVLSLFTPSLKGTKAGKTVVETQAAPENMVATLVQIVPETGVARRLVDANDWQSVSVGDLVVFRANFEFDAFGRTKSELWDASYEVIGQRKVQHDLRLKGLLAGRYAEIPFSSNWVTGPSQFTMLCHAMLEYVEGLAILVNQPTATTIMLQPLAFGVGFVAPQE